MCRSPLTRRLRSTWKQGIDPKLTLATKNLHLKVGDKDGELPGSVPVHHLAGPLGGRSRHDGEPPGGAVPVPRHHCTPRAPLPSPHPLLIREERPDKSGLVAWCWRAPLSTTDCRPTAHRPKWPPRAAQAAAEFDSRVELRPSSSSSSTPGPDRSDKQQEEDWAEMLECGGDNANLLSMLQSYVNLHLASSRVRLCVFTFDEVALEGHCIGFLALDWRSVTSTNTSPSHLSSGNVFLHLPS